MPANLYLFFYSFLFLFSCESSAQKANQVNANDAPSSQELIFPDGEQDENQTILALRFELPRGFARIAVQDSSFGQYLRHLKLKEAGSLVRYFDGSPKHKKSIYAAVVDMPIGTRDLHQCADAVMRLWAEYLWGQKKYEQIHFRFTSGFPAEYGKWREGYRIALRNDQAYWKKSAQASDSYASFWKYMEMVFSYAGTLSLSRELDSVKRENMQIGDIFIRGGSPGHAVIVVDMAKNQNTGKTLFMLAQSYMPAQETQILINPENHTVWYDLDFGSELHTPEWKFYPDQLMRFPE